MSYSHINKKSYLNSMSTPVNHHYVSQCQSRQFFNDLEKKIYMYDKQLDNFYPKPTTRSLFSEDYANSKVINGKIDHLQMETELKVLIEDDYPKHLKVVEEFLSDLSDLSHNRIEKVYWSMNFLALIGIIGEYRNPIYKAAIDRTMNKVEEDMFNVLKHNLGVELPRPVKKPLTNYENRAGYMDIAFKILERMDPITFSIYFIRSPIHHFLLPDTSCYQLRSKGDIGELMQLGIPVSDKIFLLGTSGRIEREQTQIMFIDDHNYDEVLDINRSLANFAYKGVACSDMQYLKQTIRDLKSLHWKIWSH
jgi:hypothetical protein